MKTLGDVKVGESSTIVKLHGEGALRRRNLCRAKSRTRIGGKKPGEAAHILFASYLPMHITCQSSQEINVIHMCFIV